MSNDDLYTNQASSERMLSSGNRHAAQGICDWLELMLVWRAGYIRGLHHADEAHADEAFANRIAHKKRHRDFSDLLDRYLLDTRDYFQRTGK
jgi:hypothetical protein